VLSVLFHTLYRLISGFLIIYRAMVYPPVEEVFPLSLSLCTLDVLHFYSLLPLYTYVVIRSQP
jgi:hypothetical protein